MTILLDFDMYMIPFVVRLLLFCTSGVVTLNLMHYEKIAISYVGNYRINKKLAIFRLRALNVLYGAATGI